MSSEKGGAKNEAIGLDYDLAIFCFFNYDNIYLQVLGIFLYKVLGNNK